MQNSEEYSKCKRYKNYLKIQFKTLINPFFYLFHIKYFLQLKKTSSYTFSHYYGNSIRREDDNHAHRDFAQDGGFLCPSGKFFPLHLQIDINFETTFMAFIPYQNNYILIYLTNGFILFGKLH